MRFDAGIRLGMHDPVVESALARRFAGNVPPPARLAVDQGDVRGDVAAIEQGHPEMAGRVVLVVVGLRVEHPAADAHAPQIHDRFGKDRIMRRWHAMRRGIEALAERQFKLVVDEAMRRVPLPGIAVLGRDICGRIDVREILQAPRIGFADGHGSGDAVWTINDGKRQSSSVRRHLPSARRNACTLNWPSLQTSSDDQPLPRASAANEPSVYL